QLNIAAGASESEKGRLRDCDSAEHQVVHAQAGGIGWGSRVAVAHNEIECVQTRHKRRTGRYVQRSEAHESAGPESDLVSIQKHSPVAVIRCDFASEGGGGDLGRVVNGEYQAI